MISGLGNDNTAEYAFENQKIFTVLPEYEILRLYDNVPLLAQAQTLMGNRMVYGNYVEGYNLLDRFNDAVQLNYSSELVTSDIGLTTLSETRVDGQYSIDGWLNVPQSRINVDLGDNDLVAGASLLIDVQLEHYSFSGTPSFPVETTTQTTISFSYVLPQDCFSIFGHLNFYRFF